MRRRLILLMVAASALGAADLGRVKSEPNLEKRSDMAVSNAEESLQAARKSYREGHRDAYVSELAEVGDSAEMARESLAQTGKSGRRSPKYFKRAEVRTRELLRRLDDFEHEADVEDRSAISAVRKRVQDVHDDLLSSLMGKKK